MRWPWVFSLVMGAAAADARPELPARADDRNTFWSNVTDPNGDQVRVLLAKVGELMARPQQAHADNTEWAVEASARFYRDAVSLLKHARRLAPDHAEVLAQLGHASDELGNTREAIEALEASVRASGTGKVAPEVVGRLGMIYLRLGDPDTAIKWLRRAQGPLTEQTAPALVHLASALAARGQMTAAIDTLSGSIHPSLISHNFSQPMKIVMFGLAVLYDRDEQRSAAFDVIDHMQTNLQQAYGPELQSEIAKLRFAMPEDAHYFRGLLYESLGLYAEARAEWAHYAASGDPPWRARALDHITAIDAERKASPGPKRPMQVAPPSVRVLRP